MTRLCDLSNDGNTVTSVSWSERGHQLAVGTHHGYVTIWDVQASKQVGQIYLYSGEMLFNFRAVVQVRKQITQNVMQIYFWLVFLSSLFGFIYVERLYQDSNRFFYSFCAFKLRNRIKMRRVNEFVTSNDHSWPNSSIEGEQTERALSTRGRSGLE